MKERFDHKGAADYLGIAIQTLYNWRNQRRGPDYVLMGRKIMYLRSDLDKFIESNKIKLKTWEASI
jgi:predicted DNA-binding transcriptional regulator AlpA